tara:strand:+ start:67 stop:660 length:594 start_codon:yes stop_codon:yes gene_type:complete
MIGVVSKQKAIDKLNKGYPLGFQTDTLPAIGCMPEFAEIIYKLKKREKNKALILMGSDVSQLLSYVHQLAKSDFMKMAEQFWPGPLTLITPLSDEKKPTINFNININTLGLRVPNSITAKSLISETGPLATSSANISGLSTSSTATQVSKDLPGLDLLGPIPWEKCSGKASTIISWAGKGKWQLIRRGQIIIPSIDK